MLTTSVLFELLRKKFPEASLHYLINSHTVAVVENNPFIDEVLLFSAEEEKSIGKFFSFLTKIRSQKYDVVIDVYGKLSSHIMTLFSGAEKKIGYHKKLSSFIFSHPVSRIKKPQHNASLAIENRLRLLEPLDIVFEPVTPKVFLKEQEKEQVQKKLEAHHIDITKPIYMIGVLGSSDAKTYPPAYMAQLINIIVAQQPEAQILFNYIPQQEQKAKEIYNFTLPATQRNVFFGVYGKSLREFMAMMSFCDAMISNEGGAVHMAKALGKPTFIIFSPHLNKANWFGDEEKLKHVAVHLSDYTAHNEEAVLAAKKDPEAYYLTFKPSFIEPKLIDFIRNH